MPEKIANVYRGGIVESLHCGALAVVDAGGRLTASFGDADFITYLRSSCKPFQSMALLEAGAIEKMGFTSEEIALTCASHSGERMHQEVVLGLLAKAGRTVEDLRCGAHPPLHAETAKALAKEGTEPTALHSNCSGKHSGMLVHARLIDVDCEGYLEPDHPVQVRIRQVVDDMFGEAPRSVGVDGCGVPVFAFSLRRMALAFARLAKPAAAPPAHQETATLVSAAMRRHPKLVSGTGRFNGALMEAAGGSIVAKSGAEGLFCLGHLPSGQGLAVKMLDGSSRAIAPVVIDALRQLGWLDAAAVQRLADFREPVIANVAGREVGSIASTLRLEGGVAG